MLIAAPPCEVLPKDKLSIVLRIKSLSIANVEGKTSLTTLENVKIATLSVLRNSLTKYFKASFNNGNLSGVFIDEETSTRNTKLLVAKPSKTGLFNSVFSTTTSSFKSTFGVSINGFFFIVKFLVQSFVTLIKPDGS